MCSGGLLMSIVGAVRKFGVGTGPKITVPGVGRAERNTTVAPTQAAKNATTATATSSAITCERFMLPSPLVRLLPEDTHHHAN